MCKKDAIKCTANPSLNRSCWWAHRCVLIRLEQQLYQGTGPQLISVDRTKRKKQRPLLSANRLLYDSKMPLLNRSLFLCLCGRRLSLTRKLLVLLVALTVLFWVSLLGYQQRQSLVLTEQQELVAMKGVNFDTNINIKQGKNTPRVLMNANNGLVDNPLISADQVSNNKSVALKAKEKGEAVHGAELVHVSNLTNSSLQQRGVAISSKNSASPLASDMVHLDPVPSQKGPDSLQLLHQRMLKLNEKQRVLNADKFPPLSNEDGLVLIVQVHKRENYLKQLFESLKRAKGIENVLLVISHDYYYDDMNTVVESVDFCRVVQVFFPHSLQVFPDTFPGESKDDCPRDASRETAQKLNCTNAEHPDSYGHYREAKITAIKHHWWWKVNTVFDRLRETQNYTGYVIFLEEDHYVAPDFLEVAKQLIGMRNTQCTDCDFINLGMYNKVRNYAGVAHRATVGVWNAGKNNMGFGFNRDTWNVIKGCAENFCSYDDYNWDWSLNTLGTACLGRPLKVLVVKAPRVLHIGTCGTHHHKSCNEQEQARIANDKLNAQKASFFPASMSIDPGTNPAAPRRKPKNYGGWGDVRDHRLCLSFVQR